MPDRLVAPPSRVRVLLVASAAPATGGIATFVEQLLRDGQLARLVDVQLLNTTHRTVRRSGELSLENVRNAVADAVRTWSRGRRVDVVHVHAAPGRLFPLLRTVALCAAARASGAAVVCHVHSSKLNGGNPEGFRPGRVFAASLRLLGVCDVLPTVSDTGTDVLQRFVPGTPAMTVPNAVPVEEFGRADVAATPVTLLFVGTVCERKGLRVLLRACELLRDAQLPPWQLRIVGGAAEVGEQEAGALRADYERTGFGDVFAGPADADGVRSHLARAGVFVLPSLWEGQPIAVLEAMASGLPVVTTRVGALPQTVRDGVDGFVVAPGDERVLAAALARLVEDPALRTAMGARGHERATECFSMPTLRRRLLEVYAVAVERRRSRRPRRGAVPSRLGTPAPAGHA